MVRAHVDWVRDHRDRNEIIEFYESIRPSMRTLLSAPSVPFEHFIELDRIIIDRFGHGDPHFLQELGAYSAQQFFRRSAALHDQLQDFATASYRQVSATEAQLIRAGSPSFSPLYCASAIGFYHECIRLHGGKNVAVWESQCQCRGDETCTFELVWS